MKERLQAVQRIFWTILGLSIGLLIADATGGGNSKTMDALVELEQFAGQFDRAGLEATLLEHARAQGRIPLSRVAAAAADAPGVPDMTASDGSIEPSAQLSLATLGEMFSRIEASTTTLGLPEEADLVGGLAFLLARRGAEGEHRLESIELSRGGVKPADLTTFRETEAARRKLAEVRREYARAEQRFEKLDELLTQRRKWKAHWRVLKRTDEKRGEALAERNELRAQLTVASDTYQALAEKAEAFKGDGKGAAAEGLAVAKLVIKGPDKTHTLRVPVALKEREVGLPPLAGVTFPSTHAADLWNAVKDKSPGAAVAEVEQHFGWHHMHVKAGPLKLGGMTVLHLWPLVFPVLLMILRRKARSVSAGYDPYAIGSDFDLPRVGTGLTVGDTLVLVALPVVAIGWAGVALFQIDQWPIVALACAIACLALGPLATGELNEVRGLKNAVRASHSHPPAPLTESSSEP